MKWPSNLRIERRGKWVMFYGPAVNPKDVAGYCQDCRSSVLNSKRPSSHTLNCWKIVVELEDEKRNKVIEWLGRAAEFYNELTGQLSDDNILILYFQKGWKYMWSFREFMIKEWCSLKILPLKSRYFIPYRRGGSYYDSILGSWRYWYVNYVDSRLREKASRLKAECPFDGAILEWSNSKLLCPLCGLLVPLGVLFEVLENGVAEYEVKSGPRKGSILRVQLHGNVLEIREVRPCGLEG